MEFIDLLRQGLDKKASDLHLSAGLKPTLRIDGEMIPIDTAEVLSADAVATLLLPHLDENQKQRYSKKEDLDFSFAVPELKRRFRVNMFHQLRGNSAALRYIPDSVPSLEALEAPAVFKDIANEMKGLVLVTGPTGSGKSTTMAAMLNYINTTRAEHVLTIEDPIEFVHTSQKCLIDQREIYQHTESFSSALRSALREDPDIILVGELRDIETIRLALTAAETGHLVFATLHTSSAPTTINRIIDVFPGNEKAMVRAMLSESLNSVIAQTLVKRKGGGRVAIHEIMRCTPAIRNLIREDKVTQIYSSIQTGASLGMVTKEQSIQKLTAEGKI